MADLIDRQAVIDLLKKSASRDIEEVVVTEKNIKIIMDMPKSYDASEVVKQIQDKCCQRCRNILSVPNAEEYCKRQKCRIYEICDIVKAGGVE